MRKITAASGAVLIACALWGGFAHAETFYKMVKRISEDQRNQAFAISLTAAGKTCPSVTHSLVRGVDDNGVVFVAVRCKGGGDYLMMEGGGKRGRLLPCATWRAISGGSCWTPFKE